LSFATATPDNRTKITKIQTIDKPAFFITLPPFLRVIKLKQPVAGTNQTIHIDVHTSIGPKKSRKHSKASWPRGPGFEMPLKGVPS
jgi:hypothetical protein